MPLDPQFRTALDTLEAKGLLGLARGDAVASRAHYQRLALSRRGAGYAPEPVAWVADRHSTGGVPVRVYEPPNPRGATLIYLHGGGWVLGNVETHDPLCRRVANATSARVVSVDYRLAPEHPFPAGLNDAEDVLHWLRSADPDRPLACPAPASSTVSPASSAWSTPRTPPSPRSSTASASSCTADAEPGCRPGSFPGATGPHPVPP